jgi:hypothetical protein
MQMVAAVFGIVSLMMSTPANMPPPQSPPVTATDSPFTTLRNVVNGAESQLHEILGNDGKGENTTYPCCNSLLRMILNLIAKWWCFGFAHPLQNRPRRRRRGNRPKA